MSEKKNVVLTATVISAKGHCVAGHKLGDSFRVSALSAGPMCGVFYHDAIPMICTYEFGGSAPWFKDPDSFIARCPDPENEVVLRISRTHEEPDAR